MNITLLVYTENRFACITVHRRLGRYIKFVVFHILVKAALADVCNG